MTRAEKLKMLGKKDILWNGQRTGLIDTKGMVTYKEQEILRVDCIGLRFKLVMLKSGVLVLEMRDGKLITKYVETAIHNFCGILKKAGLNSEICIDNNGIDTNRLGIPYEYTGYRFTIKDKIMLASDSWLINEDGFQPVYALLVETDKVVYWDEKMKCYYNSKGEIIKRLDDNEKLKLIRDYIETSDNICVIAKLENDKIIISKLDNTILCEVNVNEIFENCNKFKVDGAYKHTLLDKLSLSYNKTEYNGSMIYKRITIENKSIRIEDKHIRV